MSSLVKTWLVALLALVLPLEGAVAAAGMLCHARPTSVSSQGAHHDARVAGHTTAHRHASHDSHDAHAGTHAHAAGGTAAARTSQGAADRASADLPSLDLASAAVAFASVDPPAIDPLGVVDAGCPACSGICSASPLPARHALSLPTERVARVQPAPTRLAPPSHVSAGLERPPRSA